MKRQLEAVVGGLVYLPQDFLELTSPPGFARLTVLSHQPFRGWISRELKIKQTWQKRQNSAHWGLQGEARFTAI